MITDLEGEAQEYSERHPINEAHERIVCDLLFWQALGKAKGWEEHPILYRRDSIQGKIGFLHEDIYDEARPNWAREPRWHYNALSFFDLLMTSGDMQAYWDEIIKK